MRILLTGASGFVGRQALAALAVSTHEVHAVSRQLPPDSSGVIWHKADLLHTDAPLEIVESVRPDCVLHLAWCVEHGKFWTDPANIDWAAATLKLAQASAASGVRRFVGAGTCYEYDWPADGVCNELDTPIRAHTLYDETKDACRHALATLASDAGMSFSWARLFFLYGPYENPGRLVSSVARALLRGEEARCSAGLAIRDFMDVRDAGAALAALASSNVEGPVNIASGAPVSVADLVRRLAQLAERSDLLRLGAIPDRTGEPPRIVADITRLKTEVGFVPTHDLDSGLRNALSFWANIETDRT